jgi:Tfp pilus assembly protein PilP
VTRTASKVSAIALAATMALAAAAIAARAQVARPAARPLAPAPVAAPAAPTTDNYSYRPEGRRDPFVSLVNRGTDREKGQRPPEGLRGIFASDLILKGILASRGSYLAIVQGPDAKRPYIAHTNDRLADGVIRGITADSLLILQEVNDPLSLTKQREIRKTLRVVEEVK